MVSFWISAGIRVKRTLSRRLFKHSFDLSEFLTVPLVIYDFQLSLQHFTTFKEFSSSKSRNSTKFQTEEYEL